MRRTFAQALKNGKIDIKDEYSKLYELFYFEDDRDGKSIRDYVDRNMINLPFRDTCLTLDEFDEKYDFNFTENPDDFDEDYLISFCEYFYNFLLYLNDGAFLSYMGKSLFIQQIQKVVENLGYEALIEDGFTIFVPKNSVAKELAQSELIPEELSYKIIEYNHHSMDLNGKKEILLKLANILEPKRKTLKETNKNLENDVFYLLNNFNIRHNNIDKGSNNYKRFVEEMSENELVEVYDLLYQMILLAFMELEYDVQKSTVEKLKEKSN